MSEREPKIFTIHHNPTRRERSELHRLSVPLRHLPMSIERIMMTCPACKSIFPPDWLKKHEISMGPVKPKFKTKGVPYNGNSRWILKSITQDCPKCRAQVPIYLPVNKMRTRGYLFGDDAEREHEGRKVYMYSLVGADQSLLPNFEKKFRLLKQRLIPNIPPESWKVHMKDIWAGTNRAKHPVLKALRFCDVNDFVEQTLTLIKESNLFVYNIALTTCQFSPNSISVPNNLKNEAYILLVLNVIDEWTGKNAQPNIFFDSEKSSQASEVIHGWARDAFRGQPTLPSL